MLDQAFFPVRATSSGLQRVPRPHPADSTPRLRTIANMNFAPTPRKYLGPTGPPFR